MGVSYRKLPKTLLLYFSKFIWIADYSMIMSKLTKSRAFTGKEMADATEDFSTQIGQGGSGSVFLGKLREEKDIAVKVLSSLHQFLNEVHHTNSAFVSFYCH